MPNCAQLQQHVLSWIQICLWGQYLCISPTRIQRTQSEVVADKRLICSSALSAINASSRFVIHFSVRVTFLPRVLTDGSTFFSIFSCTFCSTFFSSVLRECFFTHFFQYFFEYFSEYSPARVLFLVLFRVLFWVISCESTFWSNFFVFFPYFWSSSSYLLIEYWSGQCASRQCTAQSSLEGPTSKSLCRDFNGFWTLLHELETDDYYHATTREKFTLVKNILFVDYSDIFPVHTRKIWFNSSGPL